MFRTRKSKAIGGAAATLIAATAVTVALPGLAQAHDGGQKPTVVLVHGAFADSSGWDAVTKKLLDDGYPVVADPNPLRGVASDAAALRSLLTTISGPVVLVGHSYGGSVISAAATGDTNVKALVYVAAFLPETGESASGLSAKFPGSTLGAALKQVPQPGGRTDLYIDPTLFRQQFAADVPAGQARLYSIDQRPIDAAALDEKSAGPQAWHTIKSYDLISGADKNIPPAAQEFMAKRAHSVTQVVNGASHMVFVSHSATTAAFIERAARDTAK
ncbi:alpha/beta hydrolase [Actinoplanes sp. TBRC 11911]|uniref:alpha/beta fold hydrolase n=1 Tax=Actinoplanes sp. TBRC 11911 TaxID=2729386 RepID=UPI00145E23B9|nr:alpha/beta hydrolase [Actinoplanes sp. TBRC 11911]NMO50090.1 alpha/beta hydrolase [Actinoplanes sp. TBRC 11911]